MKFFYIKSLHSQFLIFVVISLLLLVFIVIGGHYKLADYALQFSKITDYSMPKFIRIGSIHSNIKELSYLVEKLTEVQSNVSRKITCRRIEEIFSLMRDDELSIFSEQNLNIKIQTIEENFNKLHALIEQRNLYSAQIHSNVSSLVKEAGTIKSYSKKLKPLLATVTSEKLYGISNVRELDSFTKRIRQLFYLLRKNIPSKFEKQILANFERILFASGGIIELKKKELNIKIRLKRMASLVSSLLYNFSGEIEFLSVNYNDTLIRESKESSLSLRRDLGTLLAVFIGYLVWLIFIVFYLKRKIINRLVALDKNIRQRIKGGNSILTDNYKDEISYITKSFNFYASKTEKQNRKLEELSLTDPLTNLPNRRMFDIQFEYELHAIQRNKYQASILVVDVDNFKLYNDNYGHLDGDNCLKNLSNVFRKIIKRDTDMVARYGGEEFIFILSNSDIKKSKKIANELINAVGELNIRHEFNGAIKHVTISIGITTINIKNCRLGKINLENADKALYAAKEKGKNTFVHYEDF